MRAERQEMLEKYPGLVIVAPAEIDPDEEIIYVDGMEGLDELMSGINAINLYTGRNDNRLEVEKFLREQDAANKVASVTEPAYAVMASAAYGNTPAYRQENSTSIHCYGYAGDFNWWINSGDIYYKHNRKPRHWRGFRSFDKERENHTRKWLLCMLLSYRIKMSES